MEAPEGSRKGRRGKSNGGFKVMTKITKESNIPYNWVGVIEKSGRLFNINIPKRIRENPKAFCNSREGISYRKLSTQFIALFNKLWILKKK